MKFEIHRKLENNIFNTNIIFKEFGGKELEPKEEMELINDFGSPAINLANIDFSGKVTKDDEGVVSISESGEELSFILNAKTLQIDENFRAELNVNPKKLDFVTIKKEEEIISEEKGDKEDLGKSRTVKKEEEEEEEAVETKDSILDDKRVVAECVCLIFEEKIKEAIEKELLVLKKMYTNFEKETPIEFTI